MNTHPSTIFFRWLQARWPSISISVSEIEEDRFLLHIKSGSCLVSFETTEDGLRFDIGQELVEFSYLHLPFVSAEPLEAHLVEMCGLVQKGPKAVEDPNAMNHPLEAPAILLANACKEDLIAVMKALEGIPVILLWTEHPTHNWWCDAIHRARLFLVCEGGSVDPSLLMEAAIFAGKRGIHAGLFHCRHLGTILPCLPPELLREKVSQWLETGAWA